MKKLVLLLMVVAGMNIYAMRSENGLDRDMLDVYRGEQVTQSSERISRDRDGLHSKTQAEMDDWIFENMNRKRSGSGKGR